GSAAGAAEAAAQYRGDCVCAQTGAALTAPPSGFVVLAAEQAPPPFFQRRRWVVLGAAFGNFRLQPACFSLKLFLSFDLKIGDFGPLRRFRFDIAEALFDR